jgi:protein TonB
MSKLHHPIVSPRPDALRLAAAFVLSLLFHALIFGSGFMSHAAKPHLDEPEPLQATLLSPPPELVIPEPPPQAAVAPPTATPAPESPPPTAVARPEPKAFAATEPSHTTSPPSPPSQPQPLFYPLEAIARGQQGEAVVRIFLDESGNALAARLERSSGYPLLDAAAVRAARSVRALPGGAFGETLLPVRFRLR